MKVYDFWESIGDIDDKIIDESNINKGPKGFTKGFIRGISIAACFALILFGIHFIQLNGNNDTPSQTGLVIKACAAEVNADKNAITLSNTKTRLLSEEQRSDNYDFHIEYNDEFGKIASSRGIWFSFSGDDISSIDFNCTQGEGVIYLDDTEFLAFTDDMKALTLNHYIAKGKTVNDIKYKKGKYINLFWSCNTYTDEVFNYILKCGYSEEQYNDLENPEMISQIKEFNEKHLNNSDEITKYFGGTITMTVHYKNGSSKTVDIDVSVDYEYDGGLHGFGYYELICK